MKIKGSDTEIKSLCDGYWEWLIKHENPSYEITGKYLFFSTSRNRLIKIARNEIQHNNFHLAKIPMQGKNISNEYVLCLYYRDDGRKHELAKKYRHQKGLKFRYWKSDEATLKGEYSEEFLTFLSNKGK
ncbi:MAG: hypothetical protein ACE5HX_09000 [bacterium]